MEAAILTAVQELASWFTLNIRALVMYGDLLSDAERQVYASRTTKVEFNDVENAGDNYLCRYGPEWVKPVLAAHLTQPSAALTEVSFVLYVLAGCSRCMDRNCMARNCSKGSSSLVLVRVRSSKNAGKPCQTGIRDCESAAGIQVGTLCRAGASALLQGGGALVVLQRIPGPVCWGVDQHTILVGMSTSIHS